MSIRVLFFASLADITGTPETRLEASEHTTVGSVLAKLAAQLESYRGSLLSARNTEYATPHTPVQDGDEIAFFPPVSGG
jgi:molybdopterin synthase sulfur carrier subunit